jgi:HAD superfamily hydrolase (TIGR01509 family)
MTDCILFDCDGTLVDSEGLCNRGLVELFGELGVNLTLAELVRDFRGRKLTETLEILSREHGVDLDTNFVPRYRDYVAHLFASELKPIDGVREMLQVLPLARAVVSSGPPEKIYQSLTLCRLSEYFGDNVYSSFEVGIWKPDPGIYLHAAHDMGFSPGQCVVVEDSLAGVEAGVRAGMKTLFYNRFNEAMPFDSVMSFHSMQELPSLIDC